MLDSSNDTVAILYDIENAPIEMLQYTIDIAQRYQPCRDRRLRLGGTSRSEALGSAHGVPGLYLSADQPYLSGEKFPGFRPL